MSLRFPIVAAVLLVGCADDEPAEHLVAKQTHLIQYQSCSQLERDLEDMLIREISADIDSWDRNYGIEDTAGEPASDSGGGRQEGVDFSGTNNQENGVDEADLVKTDGYHIYALNGHQLHIFAVPEFGQLQPVSTTNVEGHVRQMLVDKDTNRAVVFSYINVSTLPKEHPLRAAVGYVPPESDDGWYWRSPWVSKITVFDMSDRANLRLVKELYFEGYYQTARKVGAGVNVSSYAYIDRRELWDWYDFVDDIGKSQTKVIVSKRIRDLSLADLTPQMWVRDPDGTFTAKGLSTADCRSYFRPYDSHARGFSSLMSFNLLAGDITWDADHVVSNWSTFYQSKDRIVLAEAAHSWWWYWNYPRDIDQLNVHVFDSSRAGKASYIGSGRVDGMLSDQFAIDEHDGAIRLATTTGMFWRWWDDGDERPTPENHIWVLEPDGDKYTPVGHVGGIAKGERIMSARFMDDKAAIVTFRNIDPLFTIDLRDNRNPKLVGELKVPGFSTYIHPLGTDNLLTIGVGGDENGANWKTSISLFDVKDFANPALGSSLQIAADSGWSWSEAQWEHKAFQYWGPKKLLAIPQSTYAHTSSGYRYVSKLEVIEVDPTLGAQGLRLRGAIDHTPYYMADPDRYWFYVDIRRSIFMGDYIYAISDKAISVHRTSDLVKVTDTRLPGFDQNDWWWWW